MPVRPGRRPVHRPLRTALATGLAAALAAGCASQARPAHVGSPLSATPAATASAFSGPVLLDERAGGTTIRVRTGTTVWVRLRSVYWSTPSSSAPAVLARTGGGARSGGTCPPGGGCGVSTARFAARRPGTAHVTAHRGSCGEAMRCPPGRERYAVTVVVTAPEHA